MVATKKYRDKRADVEAITFEDFVEYGKKNCNHYGPNSMPWSFKYRGLAITHETDTCYLIPTLDGAHKFFTPEDILITDQKGVVSPYNKKDFESDYALII